MESEQLNRTHAGRGRQHPCPHGPPSLFPGPFRSPVQGSRLTAHGLIPAPEHHLLVDSI